jgi:CheY-like chemotaxis protein
MFMSMFPIQTENNRPLQYIVIADDDTDDSWFLSEIIREELPDMHVSAVKNGDELLQLLDSFVPDLLFLDLDMPCKNGLECLKEIRRSASLKHLPIVVFSSTSRKVNIEVAYEMGADLFITKPATVKDFKETIQQILFSDWTQHRKAGIQAALDKF